MHDYSFLEDLNPNQKEICTSDNNFVLTACPGSGKTRTITYRLAYLQQKFSSSRKYNIALTYTNRAAEEIERRLDDMGVDLSYIWTGTIHQFCMCFIIRPYAMYSDRLKKGYHTLVCKSISAARVLGNSGGLFFVYSGAITISCSRHKMVRWCIHVVNLFFDKLRVDCLFRQSLNRHPT